MTIARIISFALPAALLAAQAQAQDERGSIDQIGAKDRDAVQQISSASRQIPASARTAPVTSAASPQISSSGDGIPQAPQLTREPRGTRGAAQLYTGGRTAQPSEPLSRPSEGRTAAVTRVEGQDRCDPGAQNAQRAARACAAVIENRAAEFTRPNPATLSPEQRLLAEQRSREGVATTRDATRRLARSGEDIASGEAQAVASVVLRTAPPSGRSEPAADPTGGLSEATLTVINAIVAGANGQSSPPR